MEIPDFRVLPKLEYLQYARGHHRAESPFMQRLKKGADEARDSPMLQRMHAIIKDEAIEDT